jgi:hypothetical protein
MRILEACVKREGLILIAKNDLRNGGAERSFAPLEKFHLSQPLLRRIQGLVRSSQVFAFARKNFVTLFHFFDHRSPRGFPSA